MELFIKEANNLHPTIKFTAEISENELTLLETTVFKGERFTEKSILHIKTHYKPTEYTHFTSCHPPGVKRGFIKGEAIRLLRINSSKATFDESLENFKERLEARGYPKQDIERSLSEVNFDLRQSGLKQKQKSKESLLSFVTIYHPVVQVDLKKTLMANWSLIENQPLLKTIFKRPPIISYKRCLISERHARKNKNVSRRHLIMRHNHKNHSGNTCRSVFDFLSILTRKRACEQLHNIWGAQAC